MFTLQDLERAQAVVADAMPPTPQFAWPLLAERLGTEVWVKHENHTPTGAFKVRGGLVYMDGLRSRGIISATRGNHGQSLAYAGAKHGIPVTIVVPVGNSVEKNAAMRRLVMLHATVAFAFNAVILASSINVLAGLAGE